LKKDEEERWWKNLPTGLTVYQFCPLTGLALIPPGKRGPLLVKNLRLKEVD